MLDKIILEKVSYKNFLLDIIKEYCPFRLQRLASRGIATQCNII